MKYAGILFVAALLLGGCGRYDFPEPRFASVPSEPELITSEGVPTTWFGFKPVNKLGRRDKTLTLVYRDVPPLDGYDQQCRYLGADFPESQALVVSIEDDGGNVDPLFSAGYRMPRQAHWVNGACQTNGIVVHVPEAKQYWVGTEGEGRGSYSPDMPVTPHIFSCDCNTLVVTE